MTKNNNNSMKIVTDFSDESLSIDSKILNSSSVSLPSTPNNDTDSPKIKHTRTNSSTDPNTIPADLISSFQAHPWFANAEETFSNDLIQVIHIRYYSIGDTIIREGTKAKAMFFIIKGVVEVTSEDDEIVYAELGKGCFFGEIGVLFQVARTTSIVAKTKCIIARITASEFYELCEKHPKVAKAIHDEAVDRYTNLKTQKEERGKKLNVNLNENMLSPLKSVTSDDDLIVSTTSTTNKRISTINVDTEPFNSNNSLKNEDNETNSINTIDTNTINEQNNSNDSLEININIENASEEELHSPKIVINNDNNISMLDSSVKVIEQNTPNPQNPNLGFIQRYSGRRRASVAVWADDQLSKLQQNIQNQLNNKEKSPTGLSSFSSQIPSPINKKDNSSANSSQASSVYSSLSSISKDKESIYSNKQSMDSNLCLSNSSVISESTGVSPKKKILKLSDINMKKIENQPYLGPLPIDLMKRCISFLDYKNQFRIRRISKIFNSLITNGDTSKIEDQKWKDYNIEEPLSVSIDLSTYPKLINDNVLNTILTACGDGIIVNLDLHRCWGITDKGCKAIEKTGSEIKHLNLLDSWDITDNGLIALSTKLPNLESIDLSNCRKITNVSVISLLQNCPKLSKLSLSYCKNLSSELFSNSLIWRKVKQLNLQRCTGIFDAGFSIWKEQINQEKDDPLIPDFFRLKKLNLSDCSFLTDAAINNIAETCLELEEISLSFCCALTEECIFNLITKCKELKVLDLNYCGLAVTDDICNTIAKECKNLVCLGFRGCIQVTDEGIKVLVKNKSKLKKINCSQCSNISDDARKLLENNGIELLNNQLLINF
ncbi:RNI-like protein [Anaeromyces robustus]|uniref:RNI-like protein n=1 Tax=Anaeromyces robustus TaxID=1754192 RepID=A0A1Y1WRP8_9FUNG|nr:RNI-like protein [Anaeromyces robustus]|eukprot:ORX76221.1 RNI-like protein [Anaeromyces robustus]